MMNMAICSLSSGSSGNTYLVLSERTAVLVDAGVSARQIGLRLSGLGLSTEALDAVLITHEHQDHISGLPVLMKKLDVPFYASRGTAEAIRGTMPKEPETVAPGEVLQIGDLQVNAFSTSHDAAEPLGFSFRSGGKQISIVTDTGCVTEEIFRNMRGSDILVLESNHDVNILRIGRYPWFLKQRIASDRGHLSNEAAAEALARLIEEERLAGTEKDRTVLLAHLSRENNFPEMALATVQNVLEERGVLSRKIRIETLARTETSPLYTV
ncbi:MAG: MBL fold metallo-hydrolase [Firmicutes bacterium]|nr:MBL fold metallo-hydrolase [Bacillota bacterium]